MNDQTFGAMLGGALLVGSSLSRVQRTAERSVRFGLMREYALVRNNWVRRLSHLAAAVGAGLGLMLLLFAYRSSQRVGSHLGESVAEEQAGRPTVADTDDESEAR